MKGLLTYDWLRMRGTLIFYFIIGLALNGLGVLLLYSMGFLIPYLMTAPSLILGLIPVSGMLQDRAFRIRQTVGTLPVSRKTLVDEKYLFTLILSSASAVLYLIVVIPGCIGKGIWGDVFAGLFLTISSGMLVSMFFLPVIFRFGEEKAAKWFGFSGFLFLMLPTVYGYLGEKDTDGTSVSLLLCGIALVVTAALFAGSWRLSRKFHDTYDTV